MSTVAAEPASSTKTPPATGLRRNALGFPPLLAQGVAAISPTMTAVLIIPLAFGDAGQGTWAAYAFGTIMLLFVVGGLNQFARRSATAGSMYAYTARGLGPVAGVLSGWTLMWSYMFIAIAGLAGFAVFSAQLLAALGLHSTVTPFVFFAISGLACVTVAWKDIRLSSILTLLFEALSVACILSLAAIVLFKHGITIDSAQTQLKGVTFKGMDFAIVICIFSLVGFESATALGGEARNPLRNVPRAVVWSLLITGAFMVLMSYVEVFATRHYGASLDTLTAPLNVISSIYGVTFFKIPVCLGAMVSFFSLTLSCVNAGSRIAFPLGRHGFLPKVMHSVHRTNKTPHAAIAIFGGVIFAVAFAIHAAGTGAVTTFDDAGTLAAFGFLLAYFMISIAAPCYLHKIGELRTRNVVVAGLAFACLLVPTIGSFYPAPPSPINLFPYIFVGYLVAGGSWLFILNRLRPGTVAEIELDLERTLEASIAAALDGDEASDLAPAHGFEFAPAPSGAGMVASSAKRPE